MTGSILPRRPQTREMYREVYQVIKRAGALIAVSLHRHSVTEWSQGRKGE